MTFKLTLYKFETKVSAILFELPVPWINIRFELYIIWTAFSIIFCNSFVYKLSRTYLLPATIVLILLSCEVERGYFSFNFCKFLFIKIIASLKFLNPYF
ncbi:hypothetical protein MSHv_04860 [Mycoplasmopsis synoviae]|nr:hypothetical protein MSHv_04860 [Mycoplasmopsis synoviae]AQU48283.1 hypothetical protein ADF19_04860 [Mycoplasmopsis synoviae]